MLTLEDDRLPLAEVGERGEGLNAILLGQSFVVDLDEVHAKRVRVVVDLFQFSQYLVACRAASSVYINRE